jgi:chromosomal replication initiation ATPase DnaA
MILTHAASRALGSAVRVRVDTDDTLGGALAALGMPLPQRWPLPPSFWVRPENRLAQSAIAKMSREVKPGWDRLLLMGALGTGKTHLLRSFLFQRQRRFPRERWCLRGGEEFYRGFSRAVREGQRTVHRSELLAYDGLVLDDAHELAGKMQSQQQLIQIVEHYRSRGRLVVVAAAELSRSAKDLLPAFRSLLASGMTVRIPELSASSRVEILRHRSEELSAPEWLIEELGRSNGISLEQCFRLCREVSTLAEKMGRMPRRDEVCKAFPDRLRSDAQPDSMDLILERCAALVGAPREAIVSGARSRGAALGRHLAIYLALEVFRLQRATVRRWLGTLSPSVLPYVRRKVEKLRDEDPRIDGFVREIAEEIGRGQRFLFH